MRSATARSRREAFRAVLVTCALLLGTRTAQPAPPVSGQSNGSATLSAEEAARDQPNPNAKQKKHKKKKHKKKKHKKKKHKKKPSSSFTASGRAGHGVVHGRTTRHFDSVQIAAGMDLEYRRRFGDLELKLPVSVEHLQPLAVPLRQSKGDAAAEGTYRLVRGLKFSLGGGVKGAWRPDWPDQYQPQPDGNLARTDRYSYWKREGEAGVAVRPFKKNHARLEYTYTLTEYKQDPDFQAIERPDHLTPSNSVEHSLEATWRTYLKKSNVGVSVEFYRRRYPFTFARDRYTGHTHASPGGAPPNPLQRYTGWAPRAFGKWQITSRLVLRPALSVTFNRDTFQGYYSYVEPGVAFRLEWRPTPGPTLKLALASSKLVYGPNGYREGPSHPPLDFGSRRVDYEGKVDLTITQRITRRFSLLLDSEIRHRRTNFPDYVPGEFPAGADYDIPWDYTNAVSMLFMRYRFD